MAKFMDHAMVGRRVIFVGVTWALGGGALNGRIQDQNHYYALAAFEMFFLALVPAGLMFKVRAGTK